MATAVNRRDYGIMGAESKRAHDRGLVEAEWYACPIPRQRLKELMKRKDGPGIRDTIIWFVSLIATGYVACRSWGSWWAIPAFAVYGIIYATPAGSRWHECGHGTAFKTQWLNELVYQIASFMLLIAATAQRWSHVRHHTDTIIVGRDPEIVAPRPPVWRNIALGFFNVTSVPNAIRGEIKRACGQLGEAERSFIPATEHRKVIWEARVHLFVLAGVAVVCVYTGSFLPAMFVALPLVYGTWFVNLLTMTQHLGLNEDVLDHRLNSRTLYTNRIVRFLYWNMNYHVEHHMFPMVPYHALPALHEEMKSDCPPASPSFPAALKEVFVALWKQRKDPTYTVQRTLPDSARPYRW